MKTILLDCDGVVANFVKASLDDGTHFGETLTEDDVKVWDLFSLYSEPVRAKVIEQVGEQTFCRDIEPYPEARIFVNELKKLGSVVICTAPWNSPYWHAERVAWVKEHLDIASRDVIFASKKELIRGRYLIDDKPEHIRDWCDANPDGWGILLNRPWNRDVFVGRWNAMRVKTYAEVIGLISTLG